MNIVKYRIIGYVLDRFVNKRGVRRDILDQKIIIGFDNVLAARLCLDRCYRCSVIPYAKNCYITIVFKLEKHTITGIDEDDCEILTSEIIEVAKWWDE